MCVYVYMWVYVHMYVGVCGFLEKMNEYVAKLSLS